MAVDLSPEAFAALAGNPVFQEIWSSGPLWVEMESLRTRMMNENDPNEMFKLRSQLLGMQRVKMIVELSAQKKPEEKPRRRMGWLSPFLPRPLGG